MKHVFIINSQIKKRKRMKFYNSIRSIYKEEDILIKETSYSGHAKEIAKEISSTDENIRIYACGGDGTIHQIVNGIKDFSKVELAIIPLGTGNDFIKSFKSLTKKDFINLNNYQHPHTITCNLLEANEYYAINTASIGLDVKIAQNVDKFKFFSFLGSAIPYYLGLLYSMMHSLTSVYKIRVGEHILEDEFTFLVCGNGKYYGGEYCPVPKAEVNDDKMDICLIKKVTRRKILSLSHKYKLGTHTAYTSLVSTYQENEFEVLSPEKEIVVNLDGETQVCDSLKIKLSDKKVKLILPNP